MYRPSKVHSTSRRRGAILIVVLAMLALFAVIGLGFVYYADSEANSARLFREGQSLGGGSSVAPPDGTQAMQTFLASFIYDVGDTGNDLVNSLRGHSLARSLYGLYTASPSAGGSTTNTIGANVLPFAGVGEFNDDSAPGGNSRLLIANFTYVNGYGIVDPERTGMRSSAGASFSGSYIGKNAGYTYPDMNNFFLASLDPRTGQVLVPSFHRPAAFGSLAPTNAANWSGVKGRLLTLRPRPADQGAGFPYVPQNADGSYTGDVQNLTGNTGVQRNDSLWMDIGLPAFTWNGQVIKPLVAPLIVDVDGRMNMSAAGNITGGQRSFGGYGPWEINPANITAPAGWASVVSTLISSRYSGALTSRNGTNSNYFIRPITAGGTLQQPQPVPNYALVNWNLTAGTSFALPTGNSLTGVPTYGSYPTNIAVANHPSLFNASDWPETTGAAGRVYPTTDLRRLSARYNDSYDEYSQTTMGAYAPILQGSNPSMPSDPANPLRMLLTTGGRTLDGPMYPPATLDYQNPTYPFQKQAPAVGALDTIHPFPTNTANNTAALAAYPLPTAQTPGTYSDFLSVGGNKIWLNKMAAMGGLDLNRPLTDYRTTLTTGLSPTNVNAQGLQAWSDRHNLARDIFGRLVVATGAAASVDPTTWNVTVLAAPSTVGAPNPQYEALRYLAQLAVNIVDYIDGDDVSTAFVWNPTQSLGGTTVTVAGGTSSYPSMVVTAAILTSAAFQANFSSITTIENGVVFGTEKPRLVLNESYAEVVNDPNDQWGNPAMMQGPQKPAHVRFWLELLNPSTTPYTAGGTLGPLGDGGVNLLYDTTDTGSTAYGPYQILIAQDTAAVNGTMIQALRNPMNSRGDLTVGNGAAQLTEIKVSFDQVSALAAGGASNASKRVLPNANSTYTSAQQYAPPTGTDKSFIVLAPNVQNPSYANGMNAAIEWIPNPTTAASNNGNVVVFDPTNSTVGGTATKGLDYLIAAATPANGSQTPSQADMTPNSGNVWQQVQRHVVVLRRLANPYLPPNDPDPLNNIPSGTAFNTAKPANPYVTVDFSNGVPAFDGIWKCADTPGAQQGRQPKSAMTNQGYDPLSSGAGATIPGQNGVNCQRSSVGRAQPLAGYVASPPYYAGNTGYTTVTAQTYPTQFLLFQNPTPATANAPLHTLGRHNGTTITQPAAAAAPSTTVNPTFYQPFDWLIHFDRPLSNPLELLHASCRKPHELTQQFIQAGQWNAINPGHTAKWIDPFATGSPVTTGLYRALDLLRVKPWDYGAAMGGKIHGRINLNSAQDPGTLLALLDPQAGNTFAAADVTTIWNQLIPSRTPTSQASSLPTGTAITQYVPSQTKAEGGADTPFHTLGAAQYSGTGNFGLSDTLLRLNTTTSFPDLWLTSAAAHSYMQTEAARKLSNNVTPVSNVFAVWVTVGFFSVTNAANQEGGITRPQMGAEAYLYVPGDLRQQYFAVIDRTNLTLNPASPTTQGPRPFFTDLQPNPNAAIGSPVGTLAGATTIYVRAGAGPVVYADGVAMPISAGMTLFIGTGADPNYNPLGLGARERLTVTSASYANGIATINFTVASNGGGGLKNSYGPGALVTNAVPGNPGPQPTFDYTNALYQPVVPLVERIK